VAIAEYILPFPCSVMGGTTAQPLPQLLLTNSHTLHGMWF